MIDVSDIGIDMRELKQKPSYLLYRQVSDANSKLSVELFDVTDDSKVAYDHLINLRCEQSILGKVHVLKDGKEYIVNTVHDFMATITG